MRAALSGCRRQRSVGLVAKADAAAGEVVGRHLDNHAVADAGSDAELAHLARGVRKNVVAVLEPDVEMSVRQHLAHHAVKFDQFFLGHGRSPSPIRFPGRYCYHDCGRDCAGYAARNGAWDDETVWTD